jgi:hypothetical protein
MLKYYEDWDKGYQKKFTDADVDLKFAKSVKETLAPFNAQLKQLGIDPITKVRDLFALEQMFAQNPEQFIADLYRQALSTGRVKQENILKMLGINANGEQAEPQTSDIFAQLENKIENRLSSFEQRLSQEKVSQVSAEIDGFFSQKDEQGNLKYPHFETLRGSMAKLSDATGETDLGELYTIALFKDKTLRAEYLQKNANEQLNEVQKKSDLDKARAASLNLNSSPNANVNIKKNRGLAEIVASNVEKHF